MQDSDWRLLIEGDLSLALNEDRLAKLLESLDNDKDESVRELIRIGASCLGQFAKANFVGPSSSASSTLDDKNESKSLEALSLNGEPAYALCQRPRLLETAKRIFVDSRTKMTRKTMDDDAYLVAWWTSRTCWIWQCLFADRRAELRDIQFEQFQILDEYFAMNDQSSPETKAAYLLEKSRVYAFYYELEKAEETLTEAFDLVGLNSVRLTGVLGRKTKFQSADVAQLTLADLEKEGTMELDNALVPPRMQFPIDCALNDDTLLENTQFQSALDRRPLSPMQECALVAYLDQLRQTRSSDEALLGEVEKAYVDRLLHHPITYVCKYAALLRRCRLESTASRRVERSLAQTEQLVKEFATNVDREHPTSEYRMKYFFVVNVPPIWDVRKMESALLISLGCTSEALRIFIDLRLWDEAVNCYRRLGMLDRAEAIVREQLDERETPHMWCLLGDVIADERCYQTAWTLSGNRLSRAQSSLGMLYFARKKYEEAVEAFERALAILPLDLKSWYALGYCAKEIKNYERAAQAYRRCTTIDTDNFEPWNNLAACYIYLGDKPRAFQILLESVKCNYENWKVWENYVNLAVDTAHFREAIGGINRLVDLRGKYDDWEVLDILTRVKDEVGDDNDKEQYVKELRTLFGRITAKVVSDARIWRSYSKIHEPNDADGDNGKADEWEKYVGLLQKAHQSAVRSPAWVKDDEESKSVVEYAIKLARAQLRLASILGDGSDRSKQLKASARLTTKGMLANFGTAEDGDRPTRKELTEKLKGLLEMIENS